VNKIAGLVLAAGASARMGQPKQLLPAGGMAVLDRVLQQALKSRLDLVVVVLGHKAQEIKNNLSSDLSHPKFKVVHNKDYRKGMSSSIIAGLSVVENDYDHIMIILGDMPLVSSDVIDHLIEEVLKSGKPLGAIKVGNRRSHPVVISRSFYPQLHQLKGDIGARHVLAENSEKICFVSPGQDFKDLDIDSMEDYLGLKKFLEDQGEKE